MTSHHRFLNCRAGAASLALLLASLLAPGCATTASNVAEAPAANPGDAITLLEGDVVNISFPGAPDLNTQQQIRRDGRLSLSLVGEIEAAGLTPQQLERRLLDLYESQLVTKEVTVTVVSSSFPVFVTGAVVRPGKIQSDRKITALEAIMEAGGFDHARANMAEVVVTRHENGEYKKYLINLKDVLQGESNQPFYLKPSDIVFVPERFSWF